MDQCIRVKNWLIALDVVKIATYTATSSLGPYFRNDLLDTLVTFLGELAL